METLAAVAGGFVGLFATFVLLFVFDRFVDTPRWARACPHAERRRAGGVVCACVGGALAVEPARSGATREAAAAAFQDARRPAAGRDRADGDGRSAGEHFARAAARGDPAGGGGIGPLRFCASGAGASGAALGARGDGARGPGGGPVRLRAKGGDKRARPLGACRGRRSSATPLPASKRCRTNSSWRTARRLKSRAD